MTADVPECREWFWDNGQLQMRWFSLNRKKHNANGPAMEVWSDDGLEYYCEFWINNEELSEEDFLAWQERLQRQRELAALVFALEHKIPATAPEREFLRHILPAFMTSEAAT